MCPLHPSCTSLRKYYREWIGVEGEVVRFGSRTQEMSPFLLTAHIYIQAYFYPHKKNIWSMPAISLFATMCSEDQETDHVWAQDSREATKPIKIFPQMWVQIFLHTSAITIKNITFISGNKMWISDKIKMHIFRFLPLLPGERKTMDSELNARTSTKFNLSVPSWMYVQMILDPKTYEIKSAIMQSLYYSFVLHFGE
jgi:hypothetical protein